MPGGEKTSKIHCRLAGLTTVDKLVMLITGVAVERSSRTEKSSNVISALANVFPNFLRFILLLKKGSNCDCFPVALQLSLSITIMP